MKGKHLFCIITLLFFVQFSQGREKQIVSNKIVIIVNGPLPAGYSSDSIEIQFAPLQQDRFIYPFKKETISKRMENGFAKFEIFSRTPKYISPGLFSTGMGYLVEPGDSLNVKWIDGKRVFSGNAAFKFQTQKNIEYFLSSLFYPQGLSPKGDAVTSLKDYLAWNEFLNKRIEYFLNFLDSCKMKLSDLAALQFKSMVLTEIEKIRLSKFHSIRRSSIIGLVNQHGLSNEDLCKIYDSTMNNASSNWLRFERDFLFDPDYAWEMLHDENYRKKGKFFITSESDTAILGKDPADPFILQYNRIKEVYKGVVRENFMVFTLASARSVIKQIGFTPKVEALLKDYYAQPGYPEGKQRVKDFELERREKWNLRIAPEFSLTDANGNQFKSEQLKGKVTIIDFWFTGCKACMQMAPELSKVEKYFTKDTSIVFLSISIDKKREQWLKSVMQAKYTSGGGIQLYTSGQGDDHDIIKKFVVTGYPTLELIDPNGLLIKYDKKKIDPRLDDGKALIAFLQKQLSSLKDGPYVFHEGEKATAYSIDGSYLSKEQFIRKPTYNLQVQTDSRNTFTVSLKSSLQIEESEYTKPGKLFVLSDIEGNFDQFRKLLQANKIIDENYNWIFNNGHLVFAGDMFDRGKQVTECLWLIYSLEEKAKKAGGYVHFILGNHEIMNLQGDHRYVEVKYKDNARLIDKTLKQLYSEDSELGRWLRTKNIIEKIGGLLFVHGGISRKINEASIVVSEINHLARPFYGLAKNDYGDNRINTIMSDVTSPFWYRTYYDNKQGMMQQIDSTLQKFNVNRIITGHTIVADTISVHYGGKVINTDTKHAEGKSEALLIEGDHFYRVDDKGNKILLFIEEKTRK